MDRPTREQRKRETEVRLAQSRADIATSLHARAPRFAATPVRGGMLALLVKLRQRPRIASERESVSVLCTISDRKEAEALRRRLESSGAVIQVQASEP